MAASLKTIKNGKASQHKKTVAKSKVEEKWLFIKEQAVIDSTPAMKRSIDRSSGDVYTKTVTDYRGKDGTAAATAITAKTLIAARLGKTSAQLKAVAAQNRKETTKKVEEVKNGQSRGEVGKKLQVKKFQ